METALEVWYQGLGMGGAKLSYVRPRAWEMERETTLQCVFRVSGLGVTAWKYESYVRVYCSAKVSTFLG